MKKEITNIQVIEVLTYLRKYAPSMAPEVPNDQQEPQTDWSDIIKTNNWKFSNEKKATATLKTLLRCFLSNLH